MTKVNSIKLFQDKLVRSIWDEEKEAWYFSVNDVVQVLTDSKNVTDYIKKMRKRDEELSKGWGQIVTPLSVQTSGGKQKTNFADVKGVFRIIQSIHSPKAEPFKQWMAQVAAERLDQIQDPELSTTSITKAKNPSTLEENAKCAAEGGHVAAVARKELESKTGRAVVSPLSAKKFFTTQIENTETDDKPNNKE